jgi:hypothetical protein
LISRCSDVRARGGADTAAALMVPSALSSASLTRSWATTDPK